MVNDGSYDRSWNIICELAQSFSWFKGIKSYAELWST